MKRLRKIVFVLVCILTLLIPYSAPVFAALSHTDNSTELETLRLHQGGEESSGTLTEEYAPVYDEEPHGYKIGITNILKLIVSGDTNYENELYCLNAEKSFPGTTSLTYNNVANLKDSTDLNVKSLGLSAENYKALIWLINNMYLRRQAPDQKDEFLAKAFSEQIAKNDGTTVDLIKSLLTDDDIEVVQQWAMWYFTNGDESNAAAYNVKYENFAAIGITTMADPNTYRSYNEVFGTPVRQEYANALYVYLITAAMDANEVEVTYPSINKSTGPSVDVDGDYYKVGPFKVNSGTAPSESYNLTLSDGTKTIARNKYEILIEGESGFTNKNIKEIFDKNYYIYIPMEDNDITKLKLILLYSSYETNASLWTTTDTVWQPVTLITREKTPHEDQIEIEIEEKTADLALRKYITKINNTTISRNPSVDVSKLVDKTSTTASYKHAKNPLEVETGDTVIYEIRVYNEGDIAGSPLEIVDYLPEGLEFVENSEINSIYKWNVSNNGRVVTTDYLKDAQIDPFNGTNLCSAHVQIECKVKNDLKTGLVLTNVAEILEDNISDRDSTPESINGNGINTETYSGNSKNKTDLGDRNYHYEGIEDDDDFEKVIVKGEIFDLALRKFITKINTEAPKTSREPKVDVTNLKNGSSKNAVYTHSKTPLTVQRGDVVIYTIRVYNEGDIDGYAEEIADYLPDGLGFLVNHKTNIDNYWAIPTNAKSVKLSTLQDGKNNLKLSDFENVQNLDDVEVVAGKVKLTSTKLKSSNVDENNLIRAFNKSGTTLNYKDIQVACIVLAEQASDNNLNLKNIAEIQKHSDEDKNTNIKDIDSTPDTVNQDNYPGNDSNQDDNDYEILTTSDVKEFDLGLRKYITSVNNENITNRVPTITKNSDGTIRYSHTKEPVSVASNDLVTYTIRVYNEGDIDGYAEEIMDDLPKGLEFVTDNDTNKKYGWKMYDSNGNDTSDVKKATSVKTKYLSKAESEKRGENCLIRAYDPNADISTSNPEFKEVKIVFKVIETEVPKGGNRIIVNTAEITDDADKDGKDVTDRDSTPGNNKPEEDDIDTEKVYVKYFDLSLKKEIIKAIITEDGKTQEVYARDNKLMKVEINRRKTGSTTVKFVFNITVKNEGEIPGYAKEIKDHIPTGLEFIQADNPNWKQLSNNVIVTNALADTLLNPGDTASVPVILKWANSDDNFGVRTNIAEISVDENKHGSKDIDSTPDNYTPRPYEDDEDEASVLISISTGSPITYVVLSSTVLGMLATGIVLIKKYVLV